MSFSWCQPRSVSRYYHPEEDTLFYDLIYNLQYVEINRLKNPKHDGKGDEMGEIHQRLWTTDFKGEGKCVKHVMSDEKKTYFFKITDN